MKGFIITLFFIICLNAGAQTSYSKILAIRTNVDATNGTITLRWDKISSASGYYIQKKLRNDPSWINIDTLFTNADTTFTDNITNSLIGYEYQIVTTGASVIASGCVYAAINLPPNHYSGRLIVLIDSSYINYCSLEIQQFLMDIIKEGWTYSLQYVSRTTSVFNVKQFVKSLYMLDPANTKGVFILGHIAIPYSGIIYPDGHAEHQGAWPADCYYADTTFSRWTDSSVNIYTASRPENRNIPGDGKFDQWSVNSANVMLFVTRVDLFDMPSINNNDSLLIKNYLIKDHAYRSLQNKFRMRALVDDNFGYFNGEAFGQNGYRNGVNLLGKDSVIGGDYLTSMNTMDNSYLWSYGCGAGSYTSANGIGSTSNFQTNVVKSVFTMLFGSYFGDWDNSNNFLRAPLASNSSILTNCWAGRPNWSFHAMGLGECIGFTAYAQIKTPGAYIPSNYGSNFIHNELLGDPTLKMYAYETPQNLLLTNANNTAVELSWTASSDLSVTGYYIYRTASLNNPFTLLNTIPVSSLSFTDNTALLGKNYYMVRAVKLQNTISSGTFKNLSAGIMDSITLLIPLPVKLIDFTLTNNDCNISLEWKVANEQNMLNYEVLFSTDGIQYKSLTKVDADNRSNYKTMHGQLCTQFQDKTIYYKIKMVDADGSFVYSNVITTKIISNNSISIYENPVKDFLTIIGLKAKGSIKIMDIKGGVLYEQIVQQEQIKMNASFLKSGFYFLQYFNNGKATSIKFIKK